MIRLPYILYHDEDIQELQLQCSMLESKSVNKNICKAMIQFAT